MFMVLITLKHRIIDKDDVEYVSRSWPMGLVEDVDIKETWSYFIQLKITVYALEPGRIDPADPLLCRS